MESRRICTNDLGVVLLDLVHKSNAYDKQTNTSELINTGLKVGVQPYINYSK